MPALGPLIITGAAIDGLYSPAAALERAEEREEYPEWEPNVDGLGLERDDYPTGEGYRARHMKRARI
jgi:hypothetical protein